MDRARHRGNVSTLRKWDTMCAVWVALWVLLGLATTYQILQLTDLADSTVQSGGALETAAEGLQSLGDVPIIGGTTAELGAQVDATAKQIVESGEQTRSSVRALAILIGLAVAIGPSGPVLLFYVPLRRRRTREARDIRQALDDPGTHAAVLAYLAQRAVVNVPPADLLEVTSDPYTDLAEGRHVPLAEAELRRLGVPPVVVAT